MAPPQKIRALLCLPTGRKDYETEVETVRTLADDEMFATHHNAIWKNDDKSQPGWKLTPLPDIQPKCPTQVDEKAWNERVVIGNADFHMFFVRQAGRECIPAWLNPNGTVVDLPMTVRAVIMKVSPQQDCKTGCKYEHMGDLSQLSEKLDAFVAKANDIIERVGGGKSKDYLIQGEGREAVGWLNCLYGRIRECIRYKLD